MFCQMAHFIGISKLSNDLSLFSSFLLLCFSCLRHACLTIFLLAPQPKRQFLMFLPICLEKNFIITYLAVAKISSSLIMLIRRVSSSSVASMYSRIRSPGCWNKIMKIFLRLSYILFGRHIVRTIFLSSFSTTRTWFRLFWMLVSKVFKHYNIIGVFARWTTSTIMS